MRSLMQCRLIRTKRCCYRPSSRSHRDHAMLGTQQLRLWIHLLQCGAVLVYLVSSVRCLSPLEEANAIYRDGMGAFAALYGMSFDEYHVITQDNWRLQVHRVRSPGIYDGNSSRPVLLVHGSSGSSADFMINSRSESLAFILADHGYDVFLLNDRGNEFSNEKLTSSGAPVVASGKDILGTTNQLMSQYDMPATLDLIIGKTGRAKIHIVSHSQGGPTVLGFLAENHTYDDKIGHFVGLTPTLEFGDDTMPLIGLSMGLFGKWLETSPKPLFDIVAQARLLAVFQTHGNRFVYHFCYLFPKACVFAVNTVMQRRVSNALTLSPDFDVARASVVSTIWPAGVTGINIYEMSSRFRMKPGAWTKIDYRRIPQAGITNQEMYNSTKPPPIDFTKARVNMSLVFSKNDIFTGVETARRIIERLKPMGSLIVADERFSHVDFVWSWKARCLVYDFILKQFERADAGGSADYLQYRRSVAQYVEKLPEPRCATQDSV